MSASSNNDAESTNLQGVVLFIYHWDQKRRSGETFKRGCTMRAIGIGALALALLTGVHAQTQGESFSSEECSGESTANDAELFAAARARRRGTRV